MVVLPAAVTPMYLDSAKDNRRMLGHALTKAGKGSGTRKRGLRWCL